MRRKFSIALSLLTITNGPFGARDKKLDLKIDFKPLYKFCYK